MGNNLRHIMNRSAAERVARDLVKAHEELVAKNGQVPTIEEVVAYIQGSPKGPQR